MDTTLPKAAKVAVHSLVKNTHQKRSRKFRKNYGYIVMILNGFGNAVNMLKLQWRPLKFAKNSVMP